MTTRRDRFGLLVLGLALAGVTAPAEAVVIYDDPDGNTAAPGGDQGWGLSGKWGVGGGVPVGPSHFLTARHLGGQVGNAFNLNGTAYTSTAFTDIPDSDLRLVRVEQTFDSYAPLYRQAGSEVGKDWTMVGFGTHAHGAAVKTGDVEHGWLWSGTAGKNWGRNTVETSLAAENGYQLLTFDFDAAARADEGVYTAGDSGGGAFILDGGTWKLAGIGYAIDAFYRNPDDTDDAWLRAAVHNSAGLFQDVTAGPDTAKVPAAGPQFGYASQVSFYQSQIDAVTGVPEPSSLALVALTGDAMLRRGGRPART